uniref:Uncharacterized protein n=1 Tax=uncultured proteobacterium RedeBAC7D11 TaxID=295350 RepID=Q5UF80_9PROT|nr:unknown [uncultured proteobacterium RedeBAC7D11]
MGLSNLDSEISYNAKYKIDNSISPILEVGIFENLLMIPMNFCSRPFMSFTISLTLSVFKPFCVCFSSFRTFVLESPEMVF